MRHPLTVEILAMAPADRARFAAQLLDAGEVPEMVWLILDTVLVDLLQLCIDRERTWREEPTH